ncbi:MAG: hypothetical protein PHG87_07365 [Candidatus Omnitrophica bacterium]|nr:hypothetical protein [Candidatus Omnitrophota bacterium]
MSNDDIKVVVDKLHDLKVELRSGLEEVRTDVKTLGKEVSQLRIESAGIFVVCPETRKMVLDHDEILKGRAGKLGHVARLEKLENWQSTMRLFQTALQKKALALLAAIVAGVSALFEILVRYLSSLG